MTPQHRKDDAPDVKIKERTVIGPDTRVTLATAIAVAIVLLGGQAVGLRMLWNMDAKIDDINREAITVNDLEAIQDVVAEDHPEAKNIQIRRAIADARRKQ